MIEINVWYVCYHAVRVVRGCTSEVVLLLKRLLDCVHCDQNTVSLCNTSHTWIKSLF
jgi:hypothetical protein